MTAGAVEERVVSITNRRGQRLAATVSEPAQPRGGTVLVVHGLGGHRIEPHVVAVASRIAERGMRALRVDLANNAGESEGDFRDLTLSGEVEDAEDALAWLLELSGEQTAIGAAGHSFGGLVCMLLAARRREIRSLVLMSAVFDAPSRFRANFADREAEWRRRGEIDFGDARTLGIGFFDDVANWNVSAAARSVTVPTLLVHGSGDWEVSTAESHEYLAHLGSERRELHVIDQADHTYTREVWRDEAAGAAAEWFTRTIV